MSDKQDDQSRQPQIKLDLGLGGMFKGLGDLLDIVSNLAANDKLNLNQSGEFHVKGLGDQGRGVYGVSIRTARDGTPRVERFGNIRKTEEGPEVAEVREPLVDVFDESSEIVIVAELPGVSESQISVELKDDILTIETDGERRYAKELMLSAPVDPASLRRTYTNGILELRVTKA